MSALRHSLLCLAFACALWAACVPNTSHAQEADPQDTRRTVPEAEPRVVPTRDLGAREASADRIRPDTVYTIGEITVTSSREGVHPSRAAQRITMLDEEALASSSSSSVADVLESRSGLFIRRQGLGLATLSQRGTGPSKTQLLIDGMRLSDPQLGQFDLSLLPTHLFRSIEILHGPGSALYGTDGLSGIVHLRTGAGAADQVSLGTAAGAYGERLLSAGASFVHGDFAGTVSAELTHMDGDFPYVNSSLFPPQEMRRRNADRGRRSVFGMLRGRIGKHGLRGAVLYAGSRQGVPGLAGAAPEGERRWDEHARLWLEDHLPVRSGALTLRTFVHRGTLRYQNASRGLDETGRTMTTGLEVHFQKRALPGLNVTVGGTAGYGKADHPSLSSAASEIHAAAFSSATGSYGRGRLYPAVRLDTYRLPDRTRSAVSPRLGMNLQALRRVPLFLKLSAASGFRMPTFNDRFWQPGGNPDLEPERSRSYDAGLYLDGDLLRAELTGYAARYVNQIVWTDSNGDHWSPQNLERSVSRGVEASLDLRLHKAITAGTIYTYTRASDRSTPGEPSYGRQARYVPRHLIKAYGSAERGPVRIDLEGRYVGRRYVTRDESEQLGASFVANARVGVAAALGPLRARLSLAIENLLDARYAVIQGHPMPPRHARIRLLLATRQN